MFTTLLKCELISKGDKPVVRTGRGRLSYPTLFTARASEEGGTLRYSTTLVLPPAVDIDVLKEACFAVAAKKFGESWKTKYPKLPMPWHNSTDENQDGIPHWQKIGIDPKAFPLFLRTGANADYGRPNVVNAQNQPLGSDRQDQVYAGRWARLTVQPYAYEHGGSKKKGVSLGLQNVQLLEDDEPLAAMRRAAETEFEPVQVSSDASELFQ